MEDKLLTYRIVSLIIVVAGIVMFFRGTDGRYGMDVSPGLSILTSLIGVAFFINTFFVDKKKYTEEMICEKCKKKYKTEHVEIPICPKCDGKLVGYHNTNE